MKVLQYIRPYAQAMFTDRMDIYRHIHTVDEYGATVVDFPEEPLYSDVPCRLSWSELESPRNTDEDTTPIELPIKILCKYNQDVEPGDFVTITRMSGEEVIENYKGICADTAAYESHKELYFRVQEPA